MTLRFYLVLLVLFFAHNSCTAQSIDSLPDNINKVSSNFLAKIQKKYTDVTESLTRKTNHYMKRLQKQEAKMIRKMHRGGGRLVTKALLKTPTRLTPLSNNS